MKKGSKKESLVLGPIFQKVAPRIGASVFIEPEWGVVGQITFKSGRHSYFRYNTLDLNFVGSADIAKDKDYSNLFLGRMGYPVVPGSRTFFSKEWGEAIGAKGRGIDDAYRYAKTLGFPVIVKPNSGSQGSGVALISNKIEFYRAMRLIFKHDRVALVQRPVNGKDYRLVILDDQLISAYERTPLSVVGDGKSTILNLLKKKQLRFNAEKRDTRLKTSDPRISEKLRRLDLSLRSVLQKGKQVYLLDNANLSTGGDSIDVTRKVHPEFKKLAVKITKDMGLRLCGVDLMINGDISQKPDTFWVLEINAAPGLDHYAKSGSAQRKIVEELYFQVLKSMDR